MVVVYAYFLFECIIVLTSDTNDISYLLYSNFCEKKKYIAWTLLCFFSCRNLIKVSTKRHPYPKSATIHAFEQKICKCHSSSYNISTVSHKRVAFTGLRTRSRHCRQCTRSCHPPCAPATERKF